MANYPLAGNVYIDVETASEIELPAVGSDVYFAHPSTRVLCLEGITDNDELISWSEGQECPQRLREMVKFGWTFWAHGFVFERLAFERVLVPRFDFPMPLWWGCTMARARYNGLPAALEYAGQAAGLGISKDMAGARLMRTMCRPRARNADGTARWWHLEDPAKLARLKQYCLTDSKVSRALKKYTRSFSDDAQAHWEVVARMNRRGIGVDLRFARAAVAMARRVRERIDQQLRTITYGVVPAATRVQALKEWVALYGVSVASLDKRDMGKFLQREGLPQPVRDAIGLRLDAAKSSVAKYEAMLARSNAEGRVQDAHVWHGAGTGRLSSQGLQVQNFVRDIHPDALEAMRLVMTGNIELVQAFYGEPLALLSKLLRPTIIARAGRQLVGGDLSQIEARITAWLAGDKRILDVFASGRDLYTYTAAFMFGLTPEQVTALLRQAGKVCDLALGFGGSHGALHQMARMYGLTFTEQQATDLVARWRASHPKHRGLWKAMLEAAHQAVKHPGRPMAVQCPADLDFASDGKHLYMRLPSGRLITYRDVREEIVTTPWGEQRLGITACGVDSKTKRYRRYVLTYIILTENAVQGIAADVMFAGLEECDRCGYEPILSVHDELVCEPPEHLLAEVQERIGIVMTQPLTWLQGLPLQVKTWSDSRYLKQ